MVFHVVGVAEIIYSFLEPADKKSLSLTCRAMRKVYVETYFPRGLTLAPMRLSVDCGWSKSGEASLCRRCVCSRNTSPATNIMGMKGPARIGMLTHCGRPACKEAVVRRSFELALLALVADKGGASYFSKASYYALVEKCSNRPKSSGYPRMRMLHDLLISAMVKQVLSNDISDCFTTVDTHLALEASVVTWEKLCKYSSGNRTITIFVDMDCTPPPLQAPPHLPAPVVVQYTSSHQPVNFPAPVVTPFFDFGPHREDEPTPMIY